MTHKFLVGKLVASKADIENIMTIFGFANPQTINLQKTTQIFEGPTRWIVCKYKDNSGVFHNEVFNEDELVLIPEN